MGHHDAVSFQQRSGRRKPAAELCRRRVFHTSWQAGESTYIAAESPVGQLLLLSWVYDDLSDNWFQTYQQYLAPASDPTIMTPVAMWEPGQ